ncbi:MAG: SdiA-regulated domain-containing protein [Flavobacteriaceae bacterium]|nr:SdiA-regulated domain-containing protein [Flavobacteriaceae bacterium]
MKHPYIFLTCLLLLLTSCAVSYDSIKIQPYQNINLKVSEPSDICPNPVKSGHFFIASDDGYLAEINRKGEVTRTKELEIYDAEAVYANEEHVYVVDEFSRSITQLNHDLEVIRTITIPYGGGRNRSYEAFTYNPVKDKFLLFTEKDPIYLFELTTDLKIHNEIKMGKIARDISAATYYQDHLYLLSDEDKLIFKMNPSTYEILQTWYVPVINPEGLAFDENGHVLIVSDDREKLYFFNPLED